MAKEKRAAATKKSEIEVALDQIEKRLTDCRALQRGAIVIRATGPGGGDYYFDCSPGRARLTRGIAPAFPPGIEIIGSVKNIRSLLSGSKNPRALFLAGGFRVRGNRAYLSAVALELGLLKDTL